MKIIEYLKDKNILTVDLWILIVLLFLFPELPNQLKSQTLTITPITTSILISDIVGLLMISILLIIIILLCSKLRNYRYLDIHIKCKKFVSKTSKILLTFVFIFETFTFLFLLYIGISILVFIYIEIILFIYIILSCKFINSNEI